MFEAGPPSRGTASALIQMWNWHPHGASVSENIKQSRMSKLAVTTISWFFVHILGLREVAYRRIMPTADCSRSIVLVSGQQKEMAVGEYPSHLLGACDG